MNKKTIEKCQSILNIFNKYSCSSDITMDRESSTSIPEAELKFKHIVYDYDSNLPLNEDLHKVHFEIGYFPSFNKIKVYKTYIEFFINYLILKDKDLNDAILEGIKRGELK